jgi:hypothetical protein
MTDSKCDYNQQGNCVYHNERFAIFEKCIYNGLPSDFVVNATRTCPLKRAIETIKQESRNQINRDSALELTSQTSL